MFFDKKTNLIPTSFPIILIYITNKIYPGNPHFMLYELVQKSNDVNWYLQFCNTIEFKTIFDSKNTSNHYKSHESLVEYSNYSN